MAHAVSTVRIFLVDDHDLVRNAVRMVLAGEEDFEVIGEARSFADALASSSLASADVAILDVRLADGDGATLCGLLKAAHPSLTCLMLTSVDDAAARSAALAAGATAFILKTIHGTQLTEQIRSALIGAPRTPRPTIVTVVTLSDRRGAITGDRSAPHREESLQRLVDPDDLDVGGSPDPAVAPRTRHWPVRDRSTQGPTPTWRRGALHPSRGSSLRRGRLGAKIASMLAEPLRLDVAEHGHLLTEIQGNVTGSGWVGITNEAAPSATWRVGAIVQVTILEGPNRDQQAQAEIDALGGRLLLRGLTGFRW